jgi:hypothetical protein
MRKYMKKNHTIVLIITFLLFFCFISCEVPEETNPTPSPVPTPTPEWEPTIEPTAFPDPIEEGDVWVVPDSQTVTKGDSFTLNIHVHSGTKRLSSYGFVITYDARTLDATAAEAGSDGFVAAANLNNSGTIDIAGFDAGGITPGSDLDLIVITFNATNGPWSHIDIEVNVLTNENTEQIGPEPPYDGIGGVVNIDDPPE